MRNFAPRFQQLCRRVFNAVGQDSLNVSETISPAFLIDDPGATEHFRFRDERVCGGIGQSAGTAGVVPRVMIAPRVANLLVVIDEVHISSSTAGFEVQLAITQNVATFDAAALASNAVGDTRWKAAQPAVCKVRVDTPAASSGANYWAGYTGNVTTIRTRIVLVNGFVLEVAGAAVGARTMDVAFSFRERFAEPGEFMP